MITSSVQTAATSSIAQDRVSRRKRSTSGATAPLGAALIFAVGLPIIGNEHFRRRL
ncbi:hypothetical protein [Mesorhizobium sp.]|uniref:hypothetical protein n=1 Tax=Mesorhizobium sp. TaxID=1871066 RepID=UPI0025BB4C76|nr:hypothetical protein [Mesorhizobium sp.]